MRVLIPIVFLIPLLLLFAYRQHRQPQSALQRPAPAAASHKRVLIPRPYNGLFAFLESLPDRTQIEVDTSWYKNLDSQDRSPDAYPLIYRAQWEGELLKSAEFPFSDIAFSYNKGKTRDYFSVNGQRIPETVYTTNNAFPVNSIWRFGYRGGHYLIFNGHLRHFNGSGGRINFNYFFDLSGKRVRADMFRNVWGFIHSPMLYGDLNEDEDLDRVCFQTPLYTMHHCLDTFTAAMHAGVKLPPMACVDTIVITAETYRNHKWVPLKGPGGDAFYINLLLTETDSLVPGAHHWMHPLPEIYQ